MPHSLLSPALVALAALSPAVSAPQASTRPAPVPSSASARPAPSAPASDTVPTTSYRDPATGVSFRYPTVWQSSAEPQGYLPAALLDSKAIHPRLTVTFSPTGNVYEKTNLSGLSFTFATADVSDAAACRDLVANNSEIASPATTVVGNAHVAFTEGQGSDAGMSHALVFTLDSTFHNGTCLVFERDEATLSPGVVPGTRALTSAEEKALQRHLDAVFRSVTLP